MRWIQSSKKEIKLIGQGKSDETIRVKLTPNIGTNNSISMNSSSFDKERGWADR